MIVIFGEWCVRLAAELVECGIEASTIAQFAAALAHPGGARGDRGVDFHDQRAAIGDAIERPDGHAAGEAMEHAHSGQARLADLRRADEVEAAHWRHPAAALSVFDNTEAARTAAKFCALASTVAAEVGRKDRVIGKTARAQMRLVGASFVDQFPQRAGVASVSTLTMSLIFRTLVIECFDPVFARSVGAGGAWVHAIFMGLVVLNLVAAFQALGTLMAVGLMMLPALAARFWSEDISQIVLVATAMAAASSVIGLLLSFHVEWASGPSIVIVAAAFYCSSIVFGSSGGLLARWRRRPHFHEPEDASR